MANIKISALPQVTSVQSSDVGPVVAAGITSKITIQDLASSLTTVSSSISASYAVSSSYSISGSYAITSSYSTTSSYATTAIYVELSNTSSFVTSSNVWGPFGSNSILTSSYSVSSSYAVTSSYAATASSADNFFVRGSVTGSDAIFTGTITAQRLFVQYITSSTELITGSTKFGTQVTDTHQFTGSVSAFNGFTGSLQGTASWAENAISSSYSLTSSFSVSSSYATTASYSLSSSFAATASFVATASWAQNVPASGVVGLNLSQISSGSVTASVNVNYSSFQVVSGSTNLLFVSNSGLITAQRAFLSSSQNLASGSTLTVYGSGSAQPVFTVQGSQGELFSVNDSLSGSLFSVNDISGLPIIEAFSDNRVLIGSYQAPMLTTTLKTTLASGSNMIYQNLPTASYDAVFFEYSIKSGSSARAGSIMGIWSGSDANYNEVVTTDFGDTTGVEFLVMVTGSNIALTGSATTGNWTMKTIVRGI